jgi:hypothetical protein
MEQRRKNRENPAVTQARLSSEWGLIHIFFRVGAMTSISIAIVGIIAFETHQTEAIPITTIAKKRQI